MGCMGWIEWDGMNIMGWDVGMGCMNIMWWDVYNGMYEYNGMGCIHEYVTFDWV